MSETPGVYTCEGFVPVGQTRPLAVRLPYPARLLSPNTHVHWRAKDSSRAEAKEAAYWETYRTAGEWTPPPGLLALTVYIHPPDKRKRDLDNILSSLKPSIDGMCCALGIDDSRFAAVILVRGEPMTGGAVVLEVGGYANGNHPEWYG